MRLPHGASETIVFLHYVTTTCPLEPLCFCTTMVEGALFIYRTYWVNRYLKISVFRNTYHYRWDSQGWSRDTLVHRLPVIQQTSTISGNHLLSLIFLFPFFPNCPTWVSYNDIVLISAIFHKISEETNISFKTRKFQTMSYFRHNKQESYMMQI